jgi:hypothetical protein
MSSIGLLGCDIILNEITAAMARGDRVELCGFGAFSVKNRAARTGRNPRAQGSKRKLYVLQDRQGNAGAAQPHADDLNAGHCCDARPDLL